MYKNEKTSFPEQHTQLWKNELYPRQRTILRLLKYVYKRNDWNIYLSFKAMEHGEKWGKPFLKLWTFQHGQICVWNTYRISALYIVILQPAYSRKISKCNISMSSCLDFNKWAKAHRRVSYDTMIYLPNASSPTTSLPNQVCQLYQFANHASSPTSLPVHLTWPDPTIPPPQLQTHWTTNYELFAPKSSFKIRLYEGTGCYYSGSTLSHERWQIRFFRIHSNGKGTLKPNGMVLNWNLI